MKHGVPALAILLLIGCAPSTPPEIYADTERGEQIRRAAVLVTLDYTKAIVYSSDPECTAFASRGGLTVVCALALRYNKHFLAKILQHENCHHKQMHERRHLTESDCQFWTPNEHRGGGRV